MRKLTVLRLCLLLLLVLIPFTLGAEVREYNFPNGLKVLMVQDHKAPLSVFQIWYRVGSRDEISGKTGLSHLLEHMMFKGTPRFGSKEFSKMIQRLGGTDNAHTTRDYTMYYQRLPSSEIGLSIELESDRMQGLILDEEEVLAERAVVIEERRMRYEDDPQSMLYEEVVASAFKAHPYQWPIIGWMSDLEKIQREDLLNHYKNYYSPDNAVIIISGDINPDELIKKVTAHFLKLMPVSGRRSSVSKEPPQAGEKRLYLKKEAELPYVLIAYHVPSFPHEDAYSLEVLAMVLSGGKSSRLYKSIVYEKKLALGAFADYSGLSKDPYLFFMGGTAAEGKDISLLEQAIYKELEDIKANPPSELELQKAKNQIEAGFVMGQDSIYFQAEILGMFEMIGDWKLKYKYLEGIRKVTAKDLQDVVKKYLREDGRTVGILMPIEDKQ